MGDQKRDIDRCAACGLHFEWKTYFKLECGVMMHPSPWNERLHQWLCCEQKDHYTSGCTRAAHHHIRRGWTGMPQSDVDLRSHVVSHGTEYTYGEDCVDETTRPGTRILRPYAWKEAQKKHKQGLERMYGFL